MNLPVAILIVPTVLIGWLMFGGDSSPWSHFFAGQFPLANLATPAISELATTGIVLVVVLIGIGLAYWRYATAPALANAVPRLREESIRMPAVLTNLFYFDAAIDLLFVQPAQVLGTFVGRLLDPHVIDGGVRDVASATRWLGAIARSFQTGLVRAYALFLVIGALGFLAYYAFAGGVR
jgi:NADH-quinone oxidoreductase subunit L